MMDYRKSGSTCTHSNWDGKWYSSSHTVSIDKLRNHQGDTLPDWERLIIMKEVLSPEQYEFNKNFDGFAHLTDTEMRNISMRSFPTLRSEVFQWLRENVADSTDINRKDRPEGWCIGSAEYRVSGASGYLTIWFLRRLDAMKFIKKWSVYNQPEEYSNDDGMWKRLIDGILVDVEQN